MAFSTLFAVSLWFAGVDRSWFIDNCPTCVYQRDVIQLRVFTIPLHERTYEHVTILQKVATDLGVECRHVQLHRWHKHRWWGLWKCACPCINGTTGIAADLSWYDDAVRARIQEMAADDPNLRNEFSERVLRNHDWEFWKSFMKRVGMMRTTDAQQTP